MPFLGVVASLNPHLAPEMSVATTLPCGIRRLCITRLQNEAAVLFDDFTEITGVITATVSSNSKLISFQEGNGDHKAR